MARKKLTNEEFVFRARGIHGNKYDYSKVNYKHSNSNVIIICSLHGEFPQRAFHHLDGSGCGKCARRKTTEEFLKEAKKIHGDRYDYSKTVYETTSDNVIIGCPEHGEFSQIAEVHLRGSGCNLCGIERTATKKTSNTEEFISKAKKIHGNKYDYSKVDYKDSKSNVIIGCPEHGDFPQTPDNHLSRQGCSICAGNYKKSTEEFILQVRKIHGDKYDYSKVKYEGNKEKIIIGCSKHGDFTQKASHHLSGHGCDKCAREETELFSKWLEKNHDKPAYVYYFLMTNESEAFYKIGFSVQPETRARQLEIESGYTVEILNLFPGNAMSCYQSEQKLHKQFYEYNYIPEIYFAGSTECYYLDVLKLDSLFEYKFNNSSSEYDL